MKRKFISALLFGALCLTPTSTFVSCSDYDDDIENLQKQITTNAATLSELAGEKLKNVEVEVEALKSAQKGLEDAYKQADEDTRKASIAAAQALVDEAVKNLQEALDAAGARLDGQEKSVAALVEADAQLQIAIDKAAAQANHAYTLAEQAQATAKENKEELAKLAESLKQIREGLEQQISVLDGKVTDLSGRVGSLEGAIAAQKAALGEQAKTQGEKNAEIEKSVKDLEAKVNANKAALEQLVKNEIQTVMTKITEVNTRIDNVEKAYKAADEALAGQIKALEDKLNDSETGLAALSSKINSVEGLVNVLYSNLSNLITGVVFQDSQLEFVQAKVVSDVNKTGLSKQFTTVSNNITTVHFPYVGAAGAQTLVADHYNVEKNGGLIYVTINPTSVNFDKNAVLKLENSLQAAPKTATGEINAGVPEIATGHLISRATDGNKNGLYQVRLSYNNTDETKAPAAFDNDYAVFSEYKSTDSKGKEVTKKVYSKYELKLKLTSAVEVQNPDIEAVDADNSAPSGVDYRFTNDGLKGSFDLNPIADVNGKAPKVFRKYVEIVGVKNSRNVELSGAQMTTVINAVKNYGSNGAALNTVLEEPAGKAQNVAEEPNGFDRITLEIPDAYNGYTFTLRYFVQNYNGTIYAVEKKVLFSRPLFQENGIAMEHTPESAQSQETKKLESAFNKGANCVIVANSNKLWKENTASIEVIKPAGVGITAVNFYNAQTGAGKPDMITGVAFSQNSDTKASVGVLTQAQVGNIKNMTIVYNPADLDVEKEYELTVNSYDLNGNLVSTLPVKFTMKYPTSCAGLIKPNPAFFTPYNRDLKVLNGETYTAWAVKNTEERVQGSGIFTAKYDISLGFNKDYTDNHGCAIQFDYATPADYALNGDNYSYKATSTVPFRDNYTMSVPSKAVKYGAEHEYAMKVGVNYFNVASLWYAPAAQPFNLVFKSPIAYTEPKFDKSSYAIGYPEQSITISDANIVADDPSTSAADDITLFGTGRDARVKNVSVELVEKQFASLFKSAQVTANGIEIETSEAPLDGVGSISTEPITFKLIIEDFFGNKREHTFKVNVDPNTK